MLTVSLDSRLETPLYEQLYRYIRGEIETGRLAAGEKLPSKRALCAHLKISQNTVETAYEQLTAEGYLTARPRSGYYVQRMEAPLRPAPPPFSSVLQTAELPAGEAAPPPRYDFRTNAVDTDHFPFSVWARLTREILCEDSRRLLRAVHPQGDPGLRTEIARYLRDYRGILASPEQIVVGAGSEYLLGLAIQLLGRDKRYAVENPGYPKTRRIFEGGGARVVPIRLDEDGLRVDGLRRSGADVVHVTPSHHFPLGTVMPVRRRMELLRWAEETEGRIILEDDYDSEFRFAGRPIPALQGLDRNGRVIYFNTFAKTLAPSLRIGYMVLPKPLLALYQRDFLFYSSTVPSFEQHVLRRFLQDGYFERHLSRMRNRYKAKRDRLLEALTRHDPGKALRIRGAETGLHLLLQAEGRDEETLTAAAERAGVRVYGLSGYYTPDGAPPSGGMGGVVLGYAGFPPEQIEEAVARLAAAWGLEETT